MNMGSLRSRTAHLHVIAQNPSVRCDERSAQRGERNAKVCKLNTISHDSFLGYTDRSAITRPGTKFEDDVFFMSYSCHIHAIFISFMLEPDIHLVIWGHYWPCMGSRIA